MKKIVCEACKKPVALSDKFCPSCGSAFLKDEKGRAATRKPYRQQKFEEDDKVRFLSKLIPGLEKLGFEYNFQYHEFYGYDNYDDPEYDNKWKAARDLIDELGFSKYVTIYATDDEEADGTPFIQWEIESDEEALKVLATPKKDMHTCKQCKRRLAFGGSPYCPNCGAKQYSKQFYNKDLEAEKLINREGGE